MHCMRKHTTQCQRIVCPICSQDRLCRHSDLVTDVCTAVLRSSHHADVSPLASLPVLKRCSRPCTDHKPLHRTLHALACIVLHMHMLAFICNQQHQCA